MNPDTPSSAIQPSEHVIGADPAQSASVVAGLPAENGQGCAAWDDDFRRHSLVRIGPLSFRSSYMLAISLGILLLAAAGFLLEWASWTHEDFWYWSSAIAAAMAVVALVSISRSTLRFERAQLKWKLIGDSSSSALELKRPAWHKALLAASLFTFAAFIADGSLIMNGIYWDGARDLEVTIRVVDGDTGLPIAGAHIDVPQSISSFCYECGDAFQLTTDADGIAKRIAKYCMTSGYRGWAPFFRKADTFGSHFPDWIFQASAPGYQASDRNLLSARGEIQSAENFNTTKVTIFLRRLPRGN